MKTLKLEKCLGIKKLTFVLYVNVLKISHCLKIIFPKKSLVKKIKLKS